MESKISVDVDYCYIGPPSVLQVSRPNHCVLVLVPRTRNPVPKTGNTTRQGTFSPTTHPLLVPIGNVAVTRRSLSKLLHPRHCRHVPVVSITLPSFRPSAIRQPDSLDF